MATTSCPVSHSSRTLRRSAASASAPPNSERNSSGISSTAPIRPTAAGEPVSSFTCQATTMTAAWAPIWAKK